MGLKAFSGGRPMRVVIKEIFDIYLIAIQYGELGQLLDFL
jgi:hypothetical protein